MGSNDQPHDQVLRAYNRFANKLLRRRKVVCSSMRECQEAIFVTFGKPPQRSRARRMAIKALTKPSPNKCRILGASKSRIRRQLRRSSEHSTLPTFVCQEIFARQAKPLWMKQFTTRTGIRVFAVCSERAHYRNRAFAEQASCS